MVTEIKWLRSHEFLAMNPEFARNTFYRMARNGELPTVKIGRRLFVRADAMNVLAAQQMSEKKASSESSKSL
jgi:hypothetical protein